MRTTEEQRASVVNAITQEWIQEYAWERVNTRFLRNLLTDFAELQRTIAAHERCEESLREDIKELEKENTACWRQLERLKEQITSYHADNVNAQSFILMLQAERSNLRDELASARETLTAIAEANPYVHLSPSAFFTQSVAYSALKEFFEQVRHSAATWVKEHPQEKLSEKTNG